MAEPDDVFDRGVRRQARMIRVANGVSRRVLAMLSEAEAVIAAYVERRLARFFARGFALSKTARERLDGIVRGAATRSRKAFRAIVALLRDEMVGAAQVEAAAEAASVAAATGGRLNPPGKGDVRGVLSRAPIVEGLTFRQAAARVTALHADLTGRAIRAGVASGDSARDVVRGLFGRGGLAGRARRALDGLVHDAFTRASAVGRRMAYDVGRRAGLVEGYVWSALLDTSTCLTCADLNGNVYREGGPLPPAHRRCRCSPSPILVGFGAPDVPSFEAWLRRQSAEAQREVLGTTRHKLWREGRVRLDRFVNDRGRVLTLDEVRRREGLGVELDRAA